MEKKQYQVFLKNKQIGVTELEKADAPMGVVFGKLFFMGIPSGYLFLQNYCKENGIENTDWPEDNLISTGNIPNLRILDPSGIEIKGFASTISGMDSEAFEITIEGIAYPFYEEEFPQHVQAYRTQFE